MRKDDPTIARAGRLDAISKATEADQRNQGIAAAWIATLSEVETSEDASDYIIKICEYLKWADRQARVCAAGEGQGWINRIWTAQAALQEVLGRVSELGEAEAKAIADMMADRDCHGLHHLPLSLIVQKLRATVRKGYSSTMKLNLRAIADALNRVGTTAFAAKVEAILPVEEASFPRSLDRNEQWCAMAWEDVDGMEETLGNGWSRLLQHCVRATGAAPSAKWLKEVKALLDPLGDTFPLMVSRWFPATGRPRAMDTGRRESEFSISPVSAEALKGLSWAATIRPDKDVVRSLGQGCDLALRKIPGVGPRCPKWANGCVWALGQIASSGHETAGSALGQLVRLSTRVRYGATLKMIEKAMNAAAERMGMTRDDLDELGVPGYGFDAGGVRVERIGEVCCTLRVLGGEVETEWKNEKGKVVKSAPAAVKGAEHSEVMKEIKAAVKDAGQMLGAQRERLDRVVGLPKVWEGAAFRERYLEHGIVGAVARRLIWVVDGVGVLFDGDGMGRDVLGGEVELKAGSKVEPWHPIGREVGEVLAWRERLEALGVTQPFKQAHREVYLLTEAELRTGTYSNRFAAHLIRQHQFNALAGARGWRNKLRMMVDAEYPPASKELPAWGLRAEWWIEGAGDNYGADTNEAGAYLRLTTDQVRFYRAGSAQVTAHAGGGGYGRRAWGGNGLVDGVVDPMPLSEVPALAFSEVMRDVDLFVGVGSVANDPTWADGGPDGRHRTYWHDFSFGELGATATTRREVLAKLLPRMTKLAGKWELQERFLRVQGRLRGYRIHLGSGNILMEPNDQYLCIVPDRRSGLDAGEGVRFLPFEGDTQMSVILSKALLLIEDDKVSDETIVRQIRK